jgi:hypothetical protein
MWARALTAAVVAAGLAVLIGCHQKTRNLVPPRVDEVKMPPDEKRFNEPPSENWKPDPPKKADTSLLGKDRPGLRGPLGGGI